MDRARLVQFVVVAEDHVFTLLQPDERPRHGAVEGDGARLAPAHLEGLAGNLQVVLDPVPDAAGWFQGLQARLDRAAGGRLGPAGQKGLHPGQGRERPRALHKVAAADGEGVGFGGGLAVCVRYRGGIDRGRVVGRHRGRGRLTVGYGTGAVGPRGRDPKRDPGKRRSEGRRRCPRWQLSQRGAAASARLTHATPRRGRGDERRVGRCAETTQQRW